MVVVHDEHVKHLADVDLHQGAKTHSNRFDVRRPTLAQYVTIMLQATCVDDRRNLETATQKPQSAPYQVCHLDRHGPGLVCERQQAADRPQRRPLEAVVVHRSLHQTKQGLHRLATESHHRVACATQTELNATMLEVTADAQPNGLGIVAGALPHRQYILDRICGTATFKVVHSSQSQRTLAGPQACQLSLLFRHCARSCSRLPLCLLDSLRVTNCSATRQPA